jgi:hypothetical protein
MEEIHIFQKPVNNKLVLEVPEYFSNQEMEIIILPFIKNGKTKKKFNPKNYIGFMKNIDMDIEDEIKSLRTEWERNF